MVKGLPIFREYFANYQDQYVLIGGAACDLLMDEAGLPFRATKDLDLVLCVEVLSPEFGQAFWQFIEAGGYEQREKSAGEKEFYRFLKPKNPDFPAQIELFSRELDRLPVAPGSHLTPIPIDQIVDSLSAILLDEDYYNCLRTGTRQMDDISILMPEYILAFKARAFLDLTDRLNNGEDIKTKDIKKHRLDVFRLSQLLIPEQVVDIPTSIKRDLHRFIDIMKTEIDLDIKMAGIVQTTDDRLAMLQAIYQL